MNAPPSQEKPSSGQASVYEIRPAQTGEGFDLISASLATGRIHFSKQHVAIGYATLHSGARASLIHVYDADGRLVATHEQPAGRGG